MSNFVDGRPLQWRGSLVFRGKQIRRRLVSTLPKPVLLLINRKAERVEPDSLPPAERVGLDSLPPGVFDIICQYACTDGGRTAYSLALVSKVVRKSSQPSRFHSVSLVNGAVRRLDLLSRALREAQSVATQNHLSVPKLRHLCIDVRSMESTINPPSDPSTHSVAPKLPSLMFDARLVLEVSPYLETLCLLGINWDAAVPEPAEYYIRHLPFRCNGFPCLRELSISGMHTHLFKNISKRRGPLFPALSRLHIMATASNPVNFGRWLREAPHLSELRLQVTMSTSDGLIPKWMLSLERSLKRDPLSLSSDPSFLMLVLVKQEVAVDISEDDTHPSPAYQQHRARLSRLLRCTSSALVPVILVMNYIPFDIVPEQSGNDWSDVEVLQADWLARVSGTNGSSDFWSDWEEHRKELGDSRLRQISGKMPVVMPNRKAQRRVLLAQLSAQLNRLRREYGLEPIS